MQTLKPHELSSTMIDTGRGLVSVADLARMFCEILDGTEDHDIHNMTGLNPAMCSRISEVRAALRPFWLQSIKWIAT